jgi:hypothetical protein
MILLIVFVSSVKFHCFFNADNYIELKLRFTNRTDALNKAPLPSTEFYFYFSLVFYILSRCRNFY